MKNLRRFGHVYSADNLIGLATSLEEGAIREGGKVILIGWSPHIASAAILHATASPIA
jgi:3-oxoacyl-[acyl-carrier-protein] synthase III